VHESGASAPSSTGRELTWWRGTMRYAALWWTTTAWILALSAAAVEFVRLSVREPRVLARAWQQLVAQPLRDRRNRQVISSMR
jgi:hypothetical protein